MRIVIIGDGKVGYTLTEALSREGHDILVIDNQKDVLDRAEELLDVMVLGGNGASVDVQQQADVGNSDLMIAVTSADEINLICCMVARKLGCKHTIARIRNPEYAAHLSLLREELGLSMTVNPESSAAQEIFRLLQYPSFLKRDAFAKGRVEIVEIPVAVGGRFDGLRLIDLYKTVKIRVLVCAVERKDEVYIPDGNFQLCGGDKIYVTAPTQDLVALVKSTSLEQVKIRSVMLIGGSRISVYLADMLIEAGIKVKIMDNDLAKCTELCQRLPRASVIHADGASISALRQEGIEETDAVVTLTNIDEENLLISMYANHMHVPKVVTKVNRTEYNEIFRDKGIDCVVSPKMLTCADILRYVRAMQNRQGAGVITLHRMVDGKVEALEFRANQSTWYLGVPLMNIPLKKNLLIACISRNGKVLIPRGSDMIQSGDSVVVVTTGDRSFRDLNDIYLEAPRASEIQA